MEFEKAVSFDERMVKFKGHSAMKQFIKTKFIKWGLKVWVRADSKSGYIYQRLKKDWMN